MAEEFVFVGCKAPNGLILNLDRYERPDASRLDVNRIEGDRTVTLAGWAHQFNKPNLTEDSFGARLTRVPKNFWDEWFKTHAKSSLILDGTIIPPPSAGNRDNAIAVAREQEARPIMFAPVKPDARQGVSALVKDE